ncbi:hypothetical protein ACX5DB_003777 [Enterobacter ludwigii]
MKFFIPVICSALFLFGCDDTPKKSEEKNGIHIASLPVMQDVIAREVPVFASKWNASVMDKICEVAEGRLSPDQFRGWFSERGVDIQKLAEMDDGFRFVSTADKTMLVQACAAWLVASLSSPLQARGETVNNTDQLTEIMNRQTPVVKAVIDHMASLVAEVSHRSDYSSEEDFRQRVRDKFKNYAPSLIEQALKSKFRLTEYNQPGTNEPIYQYYIKDGRMHVLFNGAQWLGAEEIKGFSYRFTVNKNPFRH